MSQTSRWSEEVGRRGTIIYRKKRERRRAACSCAFIPEARTHDCGQVLLRQRCHSRARALSPPAWSAPAGQPANREPTRQPPQARPFLSISLNLARRPSPPSCSAPYRPPTMQSTRVLGLQQRILAQSFRNGVYTLLRSGAGFPSSNPGGVRRPCLLSLGSGLKPEGSGRRCPFCEDRTRFAYGDICPWFCFFFLPSTRRSRRSCRPGRKQVSSILLPSFCIAISFLLLN